MDPIELVKAVLATKSSGVKLAAAALACMEAGTNFETCPIAIPGMTREREDFDGQFIVMPFDLAALLFLAIGVWADWSWMVECAELVTTPTRTLVAVVTTTTTPTRELVAVVTTTTTTKSTQFPTRDTYWTREPRFVLLAEREHG